MTRRYSVLAMALLIAITAGCARQPSEKTMSRMSKGYFNKYGRKYKATSFGLSKIESARVDSAREWNKALVEGDLTLTHRDGTTSTVRCMFQRNDPFGWKIVSWENLR